LIFKKYIDPRFKIATFNGNAHIVIYFTNESAYYAGYLSTGSLTTGFQGIDIYTIVNYNNTLRRETLGTILKKLLSKLSCESREHCIIESSKWTLFFLFNSDYFTYKFLS
jgi:hypothetical protein